MNTARSILRREGRLLLCLALGACLSGCRLFRPSAEAPEVSPANTVPATSSDTNTTGISCLDYPSLNFDARKLPISMIVLHYTGAPFRESLNALTNNGGKNRVSSHYLVDEGGTIFRLVDETKRAWHAGVGSWNGIRDVNSASIGIEIVNMGPLPGGKFHPFPTEQIDAVTALCLDIQSRHKITDVVGHEDVAPRRKIDPGPLFPWKRLKDRGVKVRTRR